LGDVVGDPPQRRDGRDALVAGDVGEQVLARLGLAERTGRGRGHLLLRVRRRRGQRRGGGGATRGQHRGRSSGQEGSHGSTPVSGDGASDASRAGQAAVIRPSWRSTVTPSSSPISSVIRPFSTFSTVVPVNRMVLPVAAGSAPTGMSPNASPVCVPPPSHWPTT